MSQQPEKLDKLDAEHVDEMMRSEGWLLIERRLRDEAARKVRTLIDSGDNPDVTRGMILGLELALRVPAIIAKEAREAKA